MDMKYDMKPGKEIQKGWGGKKWEIKNEDTIPDVISRIGELFVYHKPDECTNHQMVVDTVKVLYFDKGKKCSNHFHCDKSEMFACALGEFDIEWICPDGTKKKRILQPADRIFIPRGTPHQMTGLAELNILVEVSTVDHPDDSYRIEKGD